MKRKDTNLYEKKITLGRDKSGRYVRKSVYGRTKYEVEQKAFELRQEYLTKTPAFAPSDEIALATFCHKWVTTEKAGSGLNTIRAYQYYINIVSNHFGGLLLSEVTQEDLRELITAYYDRPNAVKKLRQFLTLIVASAEEQELIPQGKLKPSKIPAPTMKRVTNRRALTDEEKNALFTADLTEKERAFVLMLYFTGLRREEALALTTDAIDLNNKVVTVKQVRVCDLHGVPHIIPTAKNATSLRSVPLPDRYINLCGNYLKGCTGLIWTQERSDTEVYADHPFTNFWKRIIKKLSAVCPSCSELTPHTFRHNYATMLYYSNISVKMAAKLLGHANTDMIMKIYAHLDEQKENTAEKLNKLFSDG